mmetsp:Transcript_4870/g.6945  ORF Transcript_4870/g.6945 Transcript_4870/m.6945 type:complete len:241 (-) Transcript_4870:516-1238(-)
MFSYPGAKKRNKQKKKPQQAQPQQAQSQHQAQQYHYVHNQNAPSHHVPSLSDLRVWFDYHDRDRNGYLDRNEIVSALMTTYPFTSRSRESVRNWVHNVWPLYDLDGNGYIDKCEFESSGGLGDTLRSLNPRAVVSHAPNTFHTQPTTETIQVAIPNGTHPGQQLRVRGSSGRETVTTIPPYSQWRSGLGAMPFFLCNIEEENSALVITTATEVGKNKGVHQPYTNSTPSYIPAADIARQC